MESDPDQQPLTPENNMEQLQVVTSEHENDHDDHRASSTQLTRSYDCNFCKRGFSNAQALGGHMNIHRKEKAAKLKQHAQYRFVNHERNKQPYSSNNIPLIWPPGMMMMMITDTTSTTTSLYNSPLPMNNNSSWPLMEAKPGDERSSTIKWPWILSQHDDHTAIRDELTHDVGDDHDQVGQQLPVLFFQTASSDDKDQKPDNQFHGKTHEQDFSSLAHDQINSTGSEIDLELRLGHEPNQDPSTATGTRKFF